MAVRPGLPSAALTVTGCGTLQFVAVKVSAEETLTSVLPAVRDGVIVTGPVGCVSSASVYVAARPSVTFSMVGVTVTPGTSASLTVTDTSDTVTAP